MKDAVAAAWGAGFTASLVAAGVGFGGFTLSSQHRGEDVADDRPASADAGLLCAGAPLTSTDGPLGGADGLPTAGCQGGRTPWGGGTYCDSNPYADGSYDHCVTVSVLGFGGTQCSRVCPPDPANPAVPLGWTPGTACPLRP